MAVLSLLHVGIESEIGAKTYGGFLGKPQIQIHSCILIGEIRCFVSRVSKTYAGEGEDVSF